MSRDDAHRLGSMKSYGLQLNYVPKPVMCCTSNKKHSCQFFSHLSALVIWRNEARGPKKFSLEGEKNKPRILMSKIGFKQTVSTASWNHHYVVLQRAHIEIYPVTPLGGGAQRIKDKGLSWEKQKKERKGIEQDQMSNWQLCLADLQSYSQWVYSGSNPSSVCKSYSPGNTLP